MMGGFGTTTILERTAPRGRDVSAGALRAAGLIAARAVRRIGLGPVREISLRGECFLLRVDPPRGGASGVVAVLRDELARLAGEGIPLRAFRVPAAEAALRMRFLGRRMDIRERDAEVVLLEFEGELEPDSDPDLSISVDLVRIEDAFHERSEDGEPALPRLTISGRIARPLENETRRAAASPPESFRPADGGLRAPSTAGDPGGAGHLELLERFGWSLPGPPDPVLFEWPRLTPEGSILFHRLRARVEAVHRSLGAESLAKLPGAAPPPLSALCREHRALLLHREHDQALEIEGVFECSAVATGLAPLEDAGLLETRVASVDLSHRVVSLLELPLELGRTLAAIASFRRGLGLDTRYRLYPGRAIADRGRDGSGGASTPGVGTADPVGGSPDPSGRDPASSDPSGLFRTFFEILRGCQEPFEIAPPSAANPVLVVLDRDRFGRVFETATVTVEELSARGERRANPAVLLHLSLGSSIERLAALVLEARGADLPFDLVPVQIVVSAASPRFRGEGRRLIRKLAAAGYRAFLEDARASSKRSGAARAFEAVPVLLSLESTAGSAVIDPAPRVIARSRSSVREVSTFDETLEWLSEHAVADRIRFSGFANG